MSRNGVKQGTERTDVTPQCLAATLFLAPAIGEATVGAAVTAASAYVG